MLLATCYLLLEACTDKPKQKPVVINYAKLKEDIIQVNKPAVVMENDEINAYIKAHNYVVKTTGTGLRYFFIKENPKGKKIENGNRIKVKYKVSLLDGTVCYTSEKKGPKEFTVGAVYVGEVVESGIQEGVQLMHLNDKAIFILPAHLAFGLIGDRDKIPPKSAVVYEIEVISVQ
jgi:FKBP-type peptidyl-prolyl cis-trans isomerase